MEPSLMPKRESGRGVKRGQKEKRDREMLIVSRETKRQGERKIQRERGVNYK